MTWMIRLAKHIPSLPGIGGPCLALCCVPRDIVKHDGFRHVAAAPSLSSSRSFIAPFEFPPTALYLHYKVTRCRLSWACPAQLLGKFISVSSAVGEPFMLTSMRAKELLCQRSPCMRCGMSGSVDRPSDCTAAVQSSPSTRNHCGYFGGCVRIHDVDQSTTSVPTSTVSHFSKFAMKRAQCPPSHFITSVHS